MRLTAEDGYQAQRSYSIASAPEDEHLVLTVERLDDGEVSPYLTDELRPGDELELRGPIGGYFVWEESLGGPLLLRRRRLRRRRRCGRCSATTARSGATSPLRLLYSARTRDDLIYRDELGGQRLTVDHADARAAEGWTGYTGRVDPELLAEVAWPPAERPLVYVCGPTGFVEGVADALVALGHDPTRIRTERFGPT